MQTPDIFYLVTVQFAGLGFGSANDVTADWDQAVDDYANYADHREARVFRLEMNADNQPASFTDVTGEADDEIARRLNGEAA